MIQIKKEQLDTMYEFFKEKRVNKSIKNVIG